MQGQSPPCSPFGTTQQQIGSEYQMPSASADYIRLMMDELYAWALVFAPLVIGYGGTWVCYRWKK